MAEAVAIGSMVAGAAGSIVGAAGQLYTGQAQQQMYQYQAGVARVNRQIELQNAEYEYKVGDVQAQQAGMKGRFEIGQTRAAQSASGLDIGRGTMPNVVMGELKVGAQDQGIIRANAARRAYGHQVEALKYEAEGNLDTMAAENAVTASKYAAVASILGGAASTGGKFMEYKKTFG